VQYLAGDIAFMCGESFFPASPALLRTVSPPEQLSSLRHCSRENRHSQQQHS
jgi:hypothetical protein